MLLGRELHFFGGTERDAEDLHVYKQDFGDHWALSLDDQNDGWWPAAPLPNPRNHITSAALGGQHLGDEAEGNQSEVDVYDPVQDGWSRVGDLPIPLGHMGASTVVWDGRLVVVGGVTQQRGAQLADKVADVSAYDLAADRWTDLTPLPAPRHLPSRV